MVYKSLRKIALDYVSSNDENQDHQNHDPWLPENPSSIFHYRAQNIKIALAMAAPFLGRVFLVT